jgi:ABC-type ATPase involved in cell division
MPSFKHVVELDYTPSFRTEKVVGMFDVPATEKLRKEWSVDIPIEDKEWSVGLIVGASGAGKTTIAKKAFGDSAYFNGHKWEAKNILDDFPKSLKIEEITGALSHVGLASPPSWLLPYSALSNGQRFRADLARAILETDGLLVFDEFTSVVDRTVARVGAFAAQKFVRKAGRQFVAVTCHYDVSEWLEPDWVYDVSAAKFTWGRLRRPPINITIERCHHSAWQLFKGHHYLSADFHKGARTYVAFVEGEPAALTSAINFPHPKLKNTSREHRTVVLPDFQGIGLGNLISEHLGDILLSEDRRFISTTSHPAMIGHRMRSGKWRLKKAPSRNQKPSNSGMASRTVATNRLTCSFEYVGDVDSAESSATRV